jgi:hypothetical protein
MKLSIITTTLICCLASTTFAYDYVIDSGYTPGFTLQNSKTLLMTGGWIGDLTLYDHTAATIQGTSALSQGFGGAWHISLAGYSHLDLSGGEVHYLGMNSYATATLSGGLIEQIYSYQVVAPDPHIEIICRAHSWDALTSILTGTWADDTTFNIRLFNQTPYTPVIDNIKFTIVPEPFSLLLLAAGGTILTRRRH